MITSICFSIYQFTYCHFYVSTIWKFNICLCSLYARCLLFSTVTVSSFLQFKRLLITLRSPSQDFLFIAYYITFLISVSNVCRLNPFLVLFTYQYNTPCLIVITSNSHSLHFLFKQNPLFCLFYALHFYPYILVHFV